jgi:hypothetical protein
MLSSAKIWYLPAHLLSFLSLMQRPLIQSLSPLQVILLAHFWHLEPPQSMSVSSLVILPSLQGESRSDKTLHCYTFSIMIFKRISEFQRNN